MTKSNDKKQSSKSSGQGSQGKRSYQKPTLTKYEKIKRVHAYF